MFTKLLTGDEKMKHNEGTFVGSGGVNLYFQSWHPLKASRAVIIGIHGHGDHSGGLFNIIQHLLPEGFSWYGLDLRGHGRSPGKRGHIERWRDFHSDLALFINMVRERESNSLPVFLLGHSLGGLLGLEYAINNPKHLDGIVAISPALNYHGFSPAIHAVLPLISLARPKFVFNLEQDNRKLTRDIKAIKRLNRDTLRHGKITARLGQELLEAGKRVKANARHLRVPLLMLFGLTDIITPAEDMRVFYQAVALAEKESFEYPLTLHRPFDDLNQNQVMEHLSGWLNRRTEGVPVSA